MRVSAEIICGIFVVRSVQFENITLHVMSIVSHSRQEDHFEKINARMQQTRVGKLNSTRTTTGTEDILYFLDSVKCPARRELVKGVVKEFRSSVIPNDSTLPRAAAHRFQ